MTTTMTAQYSRLGVTGIMPKLKLTRIALIMTIIFASREGIAEDMFNHNALEIDNPSTTPVDLSAFSSTAGQVPGRYRVDIYMNGELQDTRDLNFILSPSGKLVPELTPAQLDQWGVVVNAVPSLQSAQKDYIITDLGNYIPHSETNFNFSRQELKISIPQAVIRSSAQGAVDPKYWQNGIPALLLDYRFTGANTRFSGSNGTNDSYFLNLRSGANLGGWRLRNFSTWTYNKNDYRSNQEGSNSSSKWSNINTYAQHDVPAIKGRFTAGDSYTPANVFDSLQFRGAQLSSDDNMLPDSLRGFAPTVRGIANSNAQVTISQNGSVIYQTYVPPGPFTIDDLYPTSSSGDLFVTIKEANGSSRTFIQPFSTLPIMQREGYLKYGITVGRYRSSYKNGDEPILGQATLIYGLPHDMTIYGGFQTADKYSALSLGMGLGLGYLGSLSADATQAYTTLNHSDDDSDSSHNGQSYRFQYAKDIAATDSTITLSGYRYSTAGFYTFQEAMDYQDDANWRYNKRSKLQLSLTQSLMGGDWGSMSLSGYQQNYWNTGGYERNLSASYSNSVFDGVSWTMMYIYSEYANRSAQNNHQLALSFSIPLSKWLPNAYLTNVMTNDLHGKASNQLGVSGTALENNNLSYSVGQSYGNRGQGYGGTLNSNYRGTYGETNAGYNYDDNSRQVNYGVQGSLIAHQNGVTLGQSSAGEMSPVALVEAPGADGVSVQNWTGVRTDWRGYAIVPYLSPYKRTRIALDPASFGENVDLTENVTTVVPTSGAVVRAVFKTNVGQRVLINLSRNKLVVPFGATVSVTGTDSTGIVGDNGQVYLSGMPTNGSLTAKWGNDGAQQCHGTFNLPSKENSGQGHAVGVLQINVNCG